jgi:hypothetical protein
MAKTFAFSGYYLLNAGNNGDILTLPGHDHDEMGGYHLHFDATFGGFAGSITLLARSCHLKAQGDTGATWDYAPHRPGFLNGAILGAGLIYVFTYAQITTTTQTIIPASGQIIGLQVACSAGTGSLYVVPISGESAIG